MITRRSALGLAVAAMAISVSLAGCSSASKNSASPSASGDRAVILQAADKSLAAGTAKVTVATSTTIDGQKSETVGTGAVAFNGSAGNIVLLIPTAQTRIDERVVNQVIYMKLTAKNLPKEVKNKWLWVDTRDTATLQKLGINGLPPISDMLTQLKELGGTLVKAGTTKVAGQTVTAYKITVPRSEIIKRASQVYGATSQSVQALKQSPKDTHATFTVFVNQDGYIVREAQSMDLVVSGKSTNTATDLLLGDYGVKVSAKVPAKALQIDARTLFASGSGN